MFSFANGNGALQEVLLRGSGKGPKILVIGIKGVITEEPQGGVVSPRRSATTPEAIEVQVYRALLDPTIIGGMLNVSSPGGSASASDAIYHLLEKFSVVKPLVAFIPHLGASGAYYVSCAADTIIASRSALVGSIGVIMQHLNVSGLAAKLGVKAEILTTGKYKGMTSPFHELTGDERAILQTMLEEMKEQFVGVVKEGRPNLDQTKLAEITSGQVFTASHARSLGLVDEIGYEDDAIKIVKSITGAPGVSLVTYAARRPPLADFLRLLPLGRGGSITEEMEKILTKDSGKPLYLWKQRIVE